MPIQRREIIARAAAACAVATLQPWQAVHAQPAWPSRTIKFVNIAPPGTAPDTYNRIYAERLSKVLNVPVIIENRPGVAGNIASDVVAKAPPDGYTLLYAVSSSFTVNPWIYSKLTFDPEKDFQPGSRRGRTRATAPGRRSGVAARVRWRGPAMAGQATTIGSQRPEAWLARTASTKATARLPASSVGYVSAVIAAGGTPVATAR